VLSPARREALYPRVCAEAEAVAVGWATPEEVDRLNVLEATLLAAGRALEVLEVRPDVVLTDYLKIRGLRQPVEPLAKGDARSQAIAAASVIAKVTRDRWMRSLDKEYPEYGLATHKGYGVKAHLAALQEVGSSTIHRHSFRGVCWFDHERRISATLNLLLDEMARGDIPPDGGEDTWLGRGYMLPESEEKAFKEALRLRWVAEALAGADTAKGKAR
jgi:ribonuclease HII